MSDNAGVQYEIALRAKLKPAGLIHRSDLNKVASAHHPDIILNYKNKPIIIEVKHNISKVDFGQVDFTYDASGKWVLPKASKNPEFVDSIRRGGIERFVNINWKKHGRPVYFSLAHGEKATLADMRKDQANFSDLYWPCPQNIIDTYYRNKNVSYLQIKSLGFYKIQSGPAAIQRQIPLFTPRIFIRIRVKSSGMKNGGQYYSFNAAINAEKEGVVKSKYDMDKDISFLET